jgi:hypothetical protein
MDDPICRVTASAVYLSQRKRLSQALSLIFWKPLHTRNIWQSENTYDRMIKNIVFM